MGMDLRPASRNQNGQYGEVGGGTPQEERSFFRHPNDNQSNPVRDQNHNRLMTTILLEHDRLVRLGGRVKIGLNNFIGDIVEAWQVPSFLAAADAAIPLFGPPAMALTAVAGLFVGASLACRLTASALW